MHIEKIELSPLPKANGVKDKRDRDKNSQGHRDLQEIHDPG